jgi:chaperonin GroEL
MMREVALKTSDVVGDGTTTATALATIAKEGIRAVAAGIRRASYRKPHSQNDRL